MTLLAVFDPAGWGHMGGWGWGMAVAGWLFMVLLGGGLAWAVSSLAQRSDPAGPKPGNARQRLDERYARRELDRDEYIARRADLEQ
jgi:uncharacterized membrane protein